MCCVCTAILLRFTQRSKADYRREFWNSRGCKLLQLGNNTEIKTNKQKPLCSPGPVFGAGLLHGSMHVAVWPLSPCQDTEHHVHRALSVLPRPIQAISQSSHLPSQQWWRCGSSCLVPWCHSCPREGRQHPLQANLHPLLHSLQPSPAII